MSAFNNSVTIQPWLSGLNYQQYALTAGIMTGYPLYSYGPPYWSTINNNSGHHPSGQFIYAITSYVRGSDLATVTYASTGTQPNFARGSLYAITGLTDPWMNATGMVLNAAPGWIQFINPGPDNAGGSASIGAINCPEPSWTTGWGFTPTYSTQWDVKMNVITAQFEGGYSQRQAQGIASNINTWTLAFNDRTDAEVKAFMAMTQNLGAVYSTTILIPPNTLFNSPLIKYVLANPKVMTKSYGLSDYSVIATQVLEQ